VHHKTSLLVYASGTRYAPKTIQEKGSQDPTMVPEDAKITSMSMKCG